MRLLLDSVVKRLSGKGGDPVIQLQTAFGGGKTHTMLAVYHLAKGEAWQATCPASRHPRRSRRHGIAACARCGAGRHQVVAQPARDARWAAIRTLWGDLAWQVGQGRGLRAGGRCRCLRYIARQGGAGELLSRYAPCVILIDELVAYVRQFEEGKALTGGSFDSNLSFVQALTEALKAVPNAVLLASLPESDKEAGSQRGVKALAACRTTSAAFRHCGSRSAPKKRSRSSAAACSPALATSWRRNRSAVPLPTSTRQQRRLSARDAGEPLLRPPDARLPDSPGGV
jgi:predicted AAA+ superfamily ATPase